MSEWGAAWRAHGLSSITEPVKAPVKEPKPPNARRRPTPQRTPKRRLPLAYAKSASSTPVQ